MLQHKVINRSGYECTLLVQNHHDYTHVTFLTKLNTPEKNMSEPRKQFEMFMSPDELNLLISALQNTQVDWHRHNTHRETLYE